MSRFNPSFTKQIDDITIGSYIHAKYPPAPLVAAKGDSDGTPGNGTDDTITLQALTDYCFANKRTLFLDDGIYRITANVNIRSSVQGTSPNNCVIFNDGTGDAITLFTNTYYSTFKNFSVKGTALSRDGIVNCIAAFEGSDWDCSYALFENVYSYNNGRHGINHIQSWVTKYIGCKFHHNGGLGVWVHGNVDTVNSVSFVFSDIRFNGATGHTYDENYGGIRLESCTSFSLQSCIIENNDPWGVIIIGADQLVTVILNFLHMEYNGNLSAVGGSFYIDGAVTKNIEVSNSYITYGHLDDSITNYAFYFGDNLPLGKVVSRNNFFSPYVVTGIKENRPYLFDATTSIIEKTSYGVLSGLNVTALPTPGMAVNVSAGLLYMNTGIKINPAANNGLAITVADATNPRIDIIYVNSLGVVSYLAGTPGATPSAPSVPAGGQKIAEINVAAGVTEIQTSNIVIRRKTLNAEDWFPLTLINGWVAFDTARTPMIRKYSNGIVRIKGMVKNGTISQPICNLPTGYTSSQVRNFAVPSNGAYGQVTISATITPSVGSNANVYLDGISWETD